MQALYAEGSFKHDQAGVDMAAKMTRRNCYVMSIDGTTCGIITFVAGNIAQMPRHFVTHLFAAVQEDPAYLTKEVLLSKCYSDVKVLVRVREFFNFKSTNSLETLDTVLVQFVNMSQHATILDYFVRRAELSTYTKIPARLLTPTVKGLETQIVMAIKNHDHKVSASLATEGEAIPDYIVSHVFEYDAETAVGKCGSILMAHSPSAVHKILGMHVAGSQQHAFGVACVLTYEDLKECISQFTYVEQKFEETVPQFSGLFQNGKYTPMYSLDRPVHRPSGTKITPSPLFEAWTPSIKRPAQLNPYYENEVRIDPMDSALDKYVPLPFSPLIDDVFPFIANQIVDDFKKNSKTPFVPQIYNFDEAVLGVPGTDFGAISRITSPGYPYCFHANKKLGGKKDWLGTDGDYTIDSAMMKEIRAIVEEKLLLAKKNIRSEHYFVDCLKDELRTLKKYLNPRLFNVAPFDYVIEWRMYFGAFAVWLMNNKVSNGFVVGVNPYSVDWDFLAKRLLRYGRRNNIGAGDYTAFDAHQHSFIFRHILDVINMFYDDGEENKRVRTVLWLEVTNSFHVNGGTVYEWTASLPSGHPFTTIINNFYNSFLFRYCWYDLNGSSLRFISNFDEFVYVAFQGDDNVFSVHPEYETVFTEEKIAISMAKLGMIYTSDTKGVTHSKLRDITEVTFLKRMFRYEIFYDRYAAPISLDTILQTPFWTKDNVYRDQIVSDNVNTSLRELSLHSPEVFNEWAPKIIASADKHGLPLKCTNRTLLMAEVEGLDFLY